jgi:hypothetical protein
MAEVTEMHWAVTVNGKYIGHCPIDENFGMTTAETFIRQSIVDQIINKSDIEFPHVTTYKAVPAKDAPPLVLTKKVNKRKKIVKILVRPKKKVSKK